MCVCIAAVAREEVKNVENAKDKVEKHENLLLEFTEFFDSSCYGPQV